MSNLRTAQARWVSGKEFDVTTGSGHHVTLDSTVKGGGQDHGPSPMEMLLVGLAGCTGMDVIDILRKKRQAVDGLEVQVVAKRADTVPAIFTHIDLCYVVRGKNIDPEVVERAIFLSETKYCSASAMLGKAATIKTRFEIAPDKDT
jgi:putative redox protein